MHIAGLLVRVQTSYSRSKVVHDAVLVMYCRQVSVDSGAAWLVGRNVCGDRKVIISIDPAIICNRKRRICSIDTDLVINLEYRLMLPPEL